jgi:hypothetical protein
MKHLVTAAPANSDTIDGPESGILCLDPDVAALIAEVDAILCAALTPARQPPAPPATGCAVIEPRSAGRSCDGLVRPRSGPVQAVRAVQRGPPNSRTAREQKSSSRRERQVMASAPI